MKSDSDGYVSEIVVATVEQSVKDYIKDDKYRLLLVRNEVISTFIASNMLSYDCGLIFFFLIFL